MAFSLPTYSRALDTAFVNTWDKIRTEVQDNVLNSIVTWAALKKAGCFTKQVGGPFINRTIRYQIPTPLAVAKGDVFSSGETETKTMAQWTWRYLSAHVQRSIFDDQVNAGEFRIKDYVSERIMDAKDTLQQQFETNLWAAIVTDESGKEIQGLNDAVPLVTNTSATYGKITRPTAYTSGLPTGGNTFWGSKYKQLTVPVEVNLLSDMKNLYNTVHNNQEPPNLLVCDQSLFEIYEDFAEDKSQIVKDSTTELANLGFEVLRFKGKPLIWTNSSQVSSASQMLFLNTDYIEVVYDPQYWFQMSDWKTVSLQGERIAHLICACNVITDSPRRHGRLYT